MPSNPTERELEEALAKAKQRVTDLSKSLRTKRDSRAKAIRENRAAKIRTLLATDNQLGALIDDYLDKTVTARKAREQLGLPVTPRPAKKAAAKKASKANP